MVVVKCTWDFVVTGYGKRTDIKTAALKDEFVTHSSQEQGPRHTTQGCQEAKEWGAGRGQSLYCGFTKRNGHSKVSRLGLVSVDNVGQL